MSAVYLSLGSNIDRYHHIQAGLNALADRFGPMTVSTVFESEAVGFNGDNFLNLVVGIVTGLSVAQLSECLKRIEAEQGRERSAPKFSARTLDIDSLAYDHCLGVTAGLSCASPVMR